MVSGKATRHLDPAIRAASVLRVAAAVAVAAGALASAGCGSESRFAVGRDLYVAHCASCHQATGAGYAQVYPDLAGNPIVKLDDPAPTLEYVLRGRGGMPGFEATLTPRQIADIVSYVRRAWGNDASTVDVAQVR